MTYRRVVNLDVRENVEQLYGRPRNLSDQARYKRRCKITEKWL